MLDLRPGVAANHPQCQFIARPSVSDRHAHAPIYLYNVPLSCGGSFCCFRVAAGIEGSALAWNSINEVNMANWHGYVEDDDEGNACVYLQNGEDESTRELFEMVEADVLEALEGQLEDYLAEAQAEALDRNGSS